MLLKGTIYITNDINLCLTNMAMCKTIIIADEPENYRMPQAIGGSLLLPPYQALELLVDGNERDFEFEYDQYLNNDISVYKFINIILQALIVGTNIIFLVESNDIDFMKVLRRYFAVSFGIILGDSMNPFSFDINYTTTILNRLYSCDDISKETYLSLYPLEFDIDPFCVGKLQADFNMRFNNIKEAHEYFKRYSQILKNGGIIRDAVSRL